MSSALLHYNSMAGMCSQQKDGAVNTSRCSSKSRENHEGVYKKLNKGNDKSIDEGIGEGIGKGIGKGNNKGILTRVY